MKEGKLKDWTRKMKGWKIKSDLPSKNCFPPKESSHHQLQWQKSQSALVIVGSHALHNSLKVYVNVVNNIDNVLEPTPQTNITTMDSILTHYSIK